MQVCYVHNYHSNLDLYLQAVALASGYSSYEIICGKKPVNLADVKFNVRSNQIYTDQNDYLNKLEKNRS